MFKLSKEQKRWWEFLWAMTERNIKSKYKHTRLSFFWMIISPVFQMLVIGFVFQFLLPVKVNNYYVFVLIGITIWNYFSETVSKSVNVIIEERSLIQKANFSRDIIVWSNIVTNLVYFLITLCLLIFLTMLTHNLKISNLYLLLIGLILIILITSGCSFLFSAINVKHRDVNFVVSVILPLWFYATPIIYTLDILPRNWNWFLYLNPITGVMEVFRRCLLDLPIYSFNGVVLGFVLSLLIFVFSFWYFKKKCLDFSDFV
jgi:ABC-type polysaccharide/polyol phosphate export permease